MSNTRTRTRTRTNIIDCISSALDDANQLLEYDDTDLRDSLRILKTFVLCSQKLYSDASFKQFLTRIEENLQNNASALHGFCEAKSEKTDEADDSDEVDEADGIDVADETDEMEADEVSLVAGVFLESIYSLADEMDRWYVTMLDCSYSPPSTSLLTTNDILEILTWLLEILKYKAMNPLKVQLRFLKSLIHFVTKGNTEASKDLLAHSETIAINTAYVAFRGGYKGSFKYLDEMLSSIPVLVQKMKPIEPRVYEIYTKSLSGSKLSNQVFDGGASLSVKNFLDSLIPTLADIIWLGPPHIGAMKDQFQELYERLKSLRIIVKQQLMVNLDKKIQKEIADVVTDAGVLICSIYQAQIDFNFLHKHLQDKFNILLSNIAELVPQVPIFNSPRTSSYGLVDHVLEKLMEMTSSKAESNVRSHVQTIQLEFASVRSTLGEVIELRDEQVEVQTLWDRLLEVAFKLETAIDYQVLDPLSDLFSTSYDSIVEEIGNIKEDVQKVKVKDVQNIIYSHQPSQTTSSTSNEVIGFQDEEKEVLDRLTRGSHLLRVIAIAGMPGQGKTTLAKKVYNHHLLSYHFSTKAWSPISQVLDKRRVLSDLLKQVCPDVSPKIEEHDLVQQLWRSLKGKRYLIFLDDIWSNEVWNSLKDSFPDDNKGSRIILTSRSVDIVPRHIPEQEPLLLKPLSDEHSLKLMCSKLYPGQGYDFPPELHGLGMQIVARCGGLPLAIIIVAGVLANAKSEDWEEILGSFSFLSSGDNCRYTLDFSFRHLPSFLRPCFLYFGAFPEDQELSVSRLLRQWIAEGFVRKSKTTSLEDVAQGYMNMLIGRSLIMVAKRRSDGGVKTCRIHDLLRDFCLDKAKDEHFLHFAEGSDELCSINEPSNLRRITIDSDPDALIESKLYCPHARSLLLKGSDEVYKGMSSTLQFFKLLKVLDLEQIDVGDVFPSVIEQLVLLVFLAMKGRYFTIPSWIGNLSNLETLIIRFQATFSSLEKFFLPDNLWNMQKLQYLSIKSCGYFPGEGGVLPLDNLDDSPVLYELERFSGATIEWCSMEKQLRKFPNIRKLKFLLLGNLNGRERYVDKFAFPEFSIKLESLGMCGSPKLDFGVRFEFASLANLKKLKLAQLNLYWEIFSIMGNQLPSLEVLKLEQLKFKDGEECIWEMKWGEFSKLRILDLDRMPIRRWIASDDHEFECFQKLVLYGCDMLEELPCCLESIETLDEIEVRYCSGEIEDLVAKIGVVQEEDWGRSGLVITVRR